MENLFILVGFLPWILFGILAGHSLLTLDIAITIALISSVLFCYYDLKKGFILPWVTFLFFLIAFVLVFIMKNIWVAIHVGLLTNITLFLIGLGSLIINKPFTEQYAKEKTPPEVWKKPSFKWKNRIITGTWSLLFLANLLTSVFLPEKGYIFHLLTMFFTIFIGFAITLIIIEKYKVK